MFVDGVMEVPERIISSSPLGPGLEGVLTRRGFTGKPVTGSQAVARLDCSLHN